MTKYILHGGFLRKNNKLNRGFINEIVKDLPDEANILMVYFASDGKDQQEHFKIGKEIFARNAKMRDFTFVLAVENDFINQVKDANAVYLHGGSTPKLLDTIKRFPEFTNLVKGKVIAGSSAGASVFSTCNHSAQDHSIRDGLGILPIKLICHYLSEKFDVGEDAIERLNNRCSEDLELVTLKDYEWRVFEV